MSGYVIYNTSASAPAQQFSDIVISTSALLTGIVLTWNEDLAEVGFRFDGVTASAAVLTIETCANYNAGTPHWEATPALNSGGSWSSTVTADGDYRVGITSKSAVRVRVSTTGTGFVVVTTTTTAVSNLSNLAVPTPSIVAGSASLSTGQVSVASTDTVVVASRAGRAAVNVVNHGTTDVFLGATGVSITTGVLLAGVVGANITVPTSGAVYGITAGGTQTVSFMEVF